jgi:hypothetical protein
MTFLEELTAHKGRLILLKTELFWYGGRGYDGIPERVCLLMDSAPTYTAAARTAAAAALTTILGAVTAACLLIDGRPHWVWVSSDDLELL